MAGNVLSHPHREASQPKPAPAPYCEKQRGKQDQSWQSELHETADTRRDLYHERYVIPLIPIIANDSESLLAQLGGKTVDERRGINPVIRE